MWHKQINHIDVVLPYDDDDDDNDDAAYIVGKMLSELTCIKL